MERQCAQCGLMLSGPRAGQRLPRQGQLSHGLCEACYAAMRAVLAARRALKARGEQGR